MTAKSNEVKPEDLTPAQRSVLWNIQVRQVRHTRLGRKDRVDQLVPLNWWPVVEELLALGLLDLVSQQTRVVRAKVEGPGAPGWLPATAIDEPEMLPEYDIRGGVRGKYHARATAQPEPPQAPRGASGIVCVRPTGCFRPACAAEGRCRMDPAHPRFQALPASQGAASAGVQPVPVAGAAPRLGCGIALSYGRVCGRTEPGASAMDVCGECWDVGAALARSKVSDAFNDAAYGGGPMGSPLPEAPVANLHGCGAERADGIKCGHAEASFARVWLCDQCFLAYRDRKGE